MTDFLAELNEAQRAAVTAPDGPVLVVAGAGTGKTRVLTTRIAWLLGQGVPPAGILAFTFTNRAAREMRERVDRLVGAAVAPRWVGTFHATGVRILRRDGEAVGVRRDFTIYDTDDQQRLLRRVLADLEIDPRQVSPGLARSLIGRWKAEDEAPAAARAGARGWVEERAAAVYERYQEALRECNALDFDDLILRTVHLLEGCPEVRRAYATRFRHVLVDEFQDTSALQLVLIKALCGHHGNVFAVGDDDQSIYSWRGARIENMLEFDEYFGDARLLRLEQNYRSTGRILDAANAVIAHNRRRKGKNLWTAGAAGEALTVERCHDAEDEAARVVDICRAELRGGARPGDLTVLYRTNAQSRELESALRRADLAYRVVGSVAFYERREVRDLLAYLKLVANPRDVVSALRVLNVPRRQIGDTTAGRLVAAAEEAGLTLGEAAAEPDLLERTLNAGACRRLRAFFGMATRWRAAMPETEVPELLERIIADTGYLSFLQADDPVTAEARGENVGELVSAAVAFQEATDGGRLPDFLEQVALVSDADAADGAEAGEGAVRLMTIHTAKGLEFPVVVLVGCEQDLLPHVGSLDDDAGLEEERRLFYVALTRARRRVHLLHAGRRRRFGTWEDAQASPFLAEIPAALLERRGQETGLAALGSAAAGGPARGRPALGPTRRPAAGRSAADVDSLWRREISQEEVRFQPGQAVVHPEFGAGVVVRVEGSGADLLVTVDFPARGRKHLLARLSKLRPAG